jgi:PAS domain S-box-containing protein
MMHSFLTKFLKGIISGGMPEYAAGDTQKIVHFINIFSLIGMATVLIFGVVNLGAHEIVAGYSEIALGALTLLNMLCLRKSRQPEVATNVLLSIVLILMLALIISGGVDRTGIYWFSIFPIMAFFLKGKRAGALWVLALMAATLILMMLFQMNLVMIRYSVVEIRQILVSLTVLSSFIYLYFEYIREHDQILLVTQGEQLNQRNQELQAQIAKQAEVQVHQRQLIGTIDNTINQVQRQNKDLEDTKLATMNILEDLSAEKQLTEESQRKDEALLESIGEGMIATDASNKIIIANKQAEELLGYKVQEMLGRPYFDIVLPVDETGKPVPIKDRPMTLAVKSGQSSASSQYQYLRKDKTSFSVAITASPIEIKGKQIGVIVVFRDISKEKQVDKAKTEFVSLASHQLRTPLSAIGWYVEMLLSGDAGKLRAEQVDYLKEIQHGSKRLVDMVNSLLNVSRIELGTFMVEPKPTKPVEIAEEVLGEIKSLIEQKQLVLERQFAKDIPVLSLDQHLLQIILQNLISNSIKYTPDKGKITLSLGMKDDALGIKVTDTGIGIPKDQQVHIFEKLFRADNVRSTDTDGTGLGLYMVKQIVTEIGGTITFKSAPNKGTTMLVLLPRSGMKRKEGTRRLS